MNTQEASLQKRKSLESPTQIKKLIEQEKTLQKAIIRRNSTLTPSETQPSNERIETGAGYIDIVRQKTTSKKFIRLKYFFGNPETEVMCVRFDNEDKRLAYGANDGNIKIYSMKDGKQTFNINTSFNAPITSLRWRPNNYSAKGQGVLVSVNSEGWIHHWHGHTGKYLSKIQEKDHTVLALDFNNLGTQFATAGKDFSIRIYDENIKRLSATLQGATWQQSGHSNRIFAVKFIDEDPNCLISGGWDANIHIWDIRQEKSVGSFYGPSCSGDSLDYKNGTILAGSYKTQNSLQLYDLRSRLLIEEIEWEQDKQIKGTYIYTAQFSKKDNNTVIAGCCGKDEFKIFNKEDDYKPMLTVNHIQKGCYTSDHGNVSDLIAFSGGGGLVYVLTMK